MGDERFEEGTVERVVAFLVALALPIVSFPLGGELGPDWQTGNLTDRAALHLDPDVTIFFAPFIVVAWLAVLVTILAERVVAERRFTRWLVYSSVPLTFHFLVVSSIAFVGVPAILGGLIVGLWAGVLAFTRRRSLRSIAWVGYGLAALVSLAALGSVAANGLSVESLIRPLLVPLLFLVLGGPGICFAIALHRSIRLRRLAPASGPNSTDTAATAVATVAWLGGYAVAWRQAANKAVELYDALPVEQPTCWVATAAANGHPRLVGSTIVSASDGSPFAVTRQLQTLKLTELVVAAVMPNAHRRLRSGYDRWGRHIAGRLATSTQADIAYLALKPAEWLGRLVTTLALDDSAERRRRVYRTEIR